MKSQLPYMPVFIGDLLRETSGWTTEEFGAYLKLLFVQWDNGPLPDEPDRLAAICGIPVERFIEIWETLEHRFAEVDGGLVHEATAARREQYARYRETQSLKGRKGMWSRWGCPQCRTKSKHSNGHCLVCGYEATGNVVPLRNNTAIAELLPSYNTHVEDEDEDDHGRFKTQRGELDKPLSTPTAPHNPGSDPCLDFRSPEGSTSRRTV
ncbi:MAG TPA: YdaU family protein [Steroidobacteraceae bacterium]|nr:YdaU family protein [Steroidobacteraceae bacterium]